MKSYVPAITEDNKFTYSVSCFSSASAGVSSMSFGVPNPPLWIGSSLKWNFLIGQFYPNVPLLYPLKTLEKRKWSFLFSGGAEMEYCAKMG